MTRPRYWNSDRHELSFLGIPKTGSSTVRAAMGVNVNVDFTHTPLPGFTTFTVLRDPWDRIPSAFHECRRRRTLRPDYPETVEGFLQSIADHGFFDEHAAPMSDHFQEVDHVLLLDNGLEAQLSRLLREPVTLAPRNVTTDPIEPRWTAHARHLLNDLYLEDLALYTEYKFDQ